MSDAFLERLLPGSAFDAVRRTISTANEGPAIALRQPILFLGEPGVGKTHAGQVAAAHRQWLKQSPRVRELYLREKNWTALTLTTFAELSLPTLSAGLVESELFGHVKGAFTGADKDRNGIFGTQAIEDALLDEIGDVSLDLQPKLLQVLQSGMFRPVGADFDDTKHTTCRVLLATNRDLRDMVELKQFREDLFYRISQLVVEVPPLRKRPQDIPAVMSSVRDSLVRIMGDADKPSALKADTRHFEQSELDWAIAYAWPGNIREIERLIRLWLILPDRTALPDVARLYPISTHSTRKAGAEGLLKLGVESWVNEAYSGVRQPPGSIGALLKDLERVLRSTLAELKLSKDQLKVLFSDQDLENVRSRLSRYRSGSSEENT
jgi:DNA-binding NtrC family response regulator